MGLQNAAGTPLDASGVQALVTTVTPPAQVRINTAVWETYLPLGRTKGHGTSRRIKWAVGEVVPQSEIDSFFAAGTGPQLASVSPTTAAVAGGTKITLTGTNLDRATGVTVGGTACTAVTIISPTQVTAITPAKAANATNALVVTGAPANSSSINIAVA